MWQGLENEMLLYCYTAKVGNKRDSRMLYCDCHVTVHKASNGQPTFSKDDNYLLPSYASFDNTFEGFDFMKFQSMNQTFFSIMNLYKTANVYKV